MDIYVAASSADLRLQTKLNTEKATVKTTYKSSSTGIGKLLQHPAGMKDKVYNIQGTCVGTADHFEALPSGLYIINGNKNIKRIQ